MTVQLSFSPSGYTDLISCFLSKGYSIRHYSDARPEQPHLIVRHDVDFSLPAAVAMGKLERDLNVASTYFVLLRTEFYNPFSREGLAALEQILDCGHDIGLHFDAALYGGADIEQSIARECEHLESLIGRSIKTVSFHRPGSHNIGEADRLAGRFNAYGPRYFCAMGYCSDSRGAWNHGTPLEHAAVRERRALQLLIHPFWWGSPEMAPQDRLREFIRVRARELDRELARQCSIHQPSENE